MRLFHIRLFLLVVFIFREGAFRGMQFECYDNLVEQSAICVETTYLALGRIRTPVIIH